MKTIFPYYSIGHFINQPNNPTEFEITRFEEMEEPDVDDLHKHTFYEIIWVESGISQQVIDYKEYALKPQSLFFISPGQLHHFEDWQPIVGGSIMFTADFFLLNYNNTDTLFELSFLDNFYANACIELSTKAYAEIHTTIQLIFEEHTRIDSSKTICQSLLHILLAQVQRAVDADSEVLASKRNVILFKNFKNLLDSHYSEALTAGEYAQKMYISQHHLNHSVKQVTGKTATEVIRARSILEAKRLLTFTDKSVSEIASELNYFDSSYFAKLFKSETSLSPMDFKKAISEKYRITSF